MHTKALILILLAVACIRVSGQQETLAVKTQPPLLEPYFRNVIKFNPTPMLLLGEVKNVTFSYERILKRNQSFSVQAGYLLSPRLVDDTLLNLISFTHRSKQGVNLAFDYRFYPGARNKRPVPDGLYIGGYSSFYGFYFTNDFDILKTEIDQRGSLKARINIVGVGMELGYQFIFWKRLSVDLLLMGPSLSMYHTTLSIEGELDQEQVDKISDGLGEEIVNRFPLLTEIFRENEIVLTGRRAKFGLGFRYSIQIGFHF